LNNNLDVLPDIENLTYEEYKKIWGEMRPIQIEMLEKNEQCKHNLGDKFIYKNPYEKPQGVCTALLHVLDLYIWRVALGFPSWEDDNCKIYKIHCPDKKGTVWEIKKL
jgi:uncharacterized repeat protein (TIGR04076 family)